MASAATTTISEPAVAGLFYPDDADTLRRDLSAYLEQALKTVTASEALPKAVIAPHAGYVYSGPIAASAYARLLTTAAGIGRVVLLGPAHRLAFTGLALPQADALRTPLGTVPLDAEGVARLARLPQVRVSAAAHEGEHSLEVQLPFLQTVLGPFSIIPLLVGNAGAGDVAEVLEAVWGGGETLIVVSTDLSHYRDYRTAQQRDAATTAAIERLDERGIGPHDACGWLPLSGLLTAARRHGLAARVLDVRNSGDTAGTLERVVGYGAYVLR